MAGVSWFPSAGYDPFLNNAELSLGAVVFETFLYGLYTVLIIICISAFVDRKRRIHWILPVLAAAMYLVASADIGYTMWLLFGQLLKGEPLYNLLRPKRWFYVTNNLFADALLLYRCYVVWNYDKRIVVVPAVALVGISVAGFLLESSPEMDISALSWVYVLMAFILNVILTALTASRIWWFSRQTNLVISPGLLHRYRCVLRILIESGSIYCLYMIVFLALHKNRTLIIEAGLIQVVGIVPTLILAQVGLGRSQDAEANSRVPYSFIGTRQLGYNSKVNSTALTVQSRSNVPLSGDVTADTTIFEPESPFDGSIREKAARNGSWPPSPLRSASISHDHSHSSSEEPIQLAVQVTQITQVHYDAPLNQDPEVDVTEGFPRCRSRSSIKILPDPNQCCPVPCTP